MHTTGAPRSRRRRSSRRRTGRACALLGTCCIPAWASRLRHCTLGPGKYRPQLMATPWTCRSKSSRPHLLGNRLSQLGHRVHTPGSDGRQCRARSAPCHAWQAACEEARRGQECAHARLLKLDNPSAAATHLSASFLPESQLWQPFLASHRVQPSPNVSLHLAQLQAEGGSGSEHGTPPAPTWWVMLGHARALKQAIRGRRIRQEGASSAGSAALALHASGAAGAAQAIEFTHICCWRRGEGATW